MKFLQSLLLAMIFVSCNDSSSEEKTEIIIPPAPASVEKIQASLRQSHYSIKDIGFVYSFMGKEEPAEWASQMKDTSTHFKNFVGGRKKFELNFINDSTVHLKEEGEAIEALYELEKDTSNVISLLIQFEDESFSFPGATEPMVMTYTYKIEGINDDHLYLEAPREYNRKKVMYMMKKL